MAKVKIKNNGAVIDVPDGSAIAPYLEDSGILFGCRSGKCGLCACVVLAGEENLNPKSKLEEETLAKIGAPASPRNRLACQLRIKQGEVLIEY